MNIPEFDEFIARKKTRNNKMRRVFEEALNFKFAFFSSQNIGIRFIIIEPTPHIHHKSKRRNIGIIWRVSRKIDSTKNLVCVRGGNFFRRRKPAGWLHTEKIFSFRRLLLIKNQKSTSIVRIIFFPFFRPVLRVADDYRIFGMSTSDINNQVHSINYFSHYAKKYQKVEPRRDFFEKLTCIFIKICFDTKKSPT